MTQQELESMFADFGCIISSKILCNPKAGREYIRDLTVLFTFILLALKTRFLEEQVSFYVSFLLKVHQKV